MDPLAAIQLTIVYWASLLVEGFLLFSTLASALLHSLTKHSVLSNIASPEGARFSTLAVGTNTSSRAF
jgi:hypothetical protein